MSKNNLWKTAFAIIVLCPLISQVLAADWPQWRGPNRDGRSSETGLLKQWPTDGPELLWQIQDLGGGYSTPIAIKGTIYVMANDGLEDEFVKALNAQNGEILWTARVGKVGNPDQQPNFPGARSTPTVDGKQIFALGSDGDLVCLETATGKIVWQKSLRQDFGGNPGKWAYSESPLVDGEFVVCAPGGETTVVALNKNNGDVKWTCTAPGSPDAGYASIVQSEVDGIKQYVAYVASGLVGVDAATGKLLWQYDGTKGIGNMPTPVVKNGFVYSSTTRVEGALIKLSAKGDSMAVEQVYQHADLPNAIGGSVLVGDYLYGSNGKSIVCVDFKSGEIKWASPEVGAGSICYADDRLYFHGENGQVLLVAASPEKYEQVGQFTPPNRPEHTKRMEQAWAYPIVANGKFYIRDLDCLWCYDIKN